MNIALTLTCKTKMIQRYSITPTADKLRERFTVDVPEYYKPHFNASPTQLLPVITANNPQGISLFYWGETPAWAKNKTPAEKLINVWTENIAEKISIRKAIQKTRCIIPADGFYGWKKVGKKTNIPYRFVMNDKSIFSFAGLWEEYEDESGTTTQTFTIFTTASTGNVAEVQERMPVIFTSDLEKIWLKPTASERELTDLLTNKTAIALNYYPVSPGINDSTLNVPSLILPTAPADQFGNLTLFD